MKSTTTAQLRAVTYSRYSTDRQTDASIKDQQRVATEYAAKHNLALTMHHSDAGISGGAMGNRPGVLRMLEDAIAGRFDVLLVTDTTRLSRSNADLSKTVDRLRSRGVRVIGIQDGFDSANRTARMQAGLSGIMSEEFRAQIADRTRSALEMRAQSKRPVGGRTYGYSTGARAIDAAQAAVVRQIFDWYVAGWSNRRIAAELNARHVPSPGSYWANRVERRSAGWMGSGIRVVLANPLYAGTVQWNTSVWTKDPDSGKRRRVKRPKDEWVVRKDEGLRIVHDVTWQAAQRRTRTAADGDTRLKAGGKARFLLSGLLVCARCGSHYVMGDARNYGCSSFCYGKACDNSIRVKRLHLEDVLLGPIKDELLAGDRVQRIAKEMQQAFAARAKAAAQRSQEAPGEVQALDARLARLRDRLKAGDADLAPDELALAIERAEQKRAQLLAALPEAKQSARVLAMLPKAAELLRRQIKEGLDGDPRSAAKARHVLRQIVGGQITLRPEADGSLWAEYALRKMALIQACGTYGSGGRI